MEDHRLFLSIRGRLGAVEEAAVQAWRRRSPEHDRRYREVSEILAAATRGEKALESIPPSTFKLAHKAESVAMVDPALELPDSRTRPRGLKLRFRWGVAAAAVLILGFVVTRPQLPQIASSGFEIEEFATSTGETATVTLGDGTVVRLGPQSRLRLTRGGQRDVSFSGRALFSVAHDPERPFRVVTTSGEVEVLGTRFEIESDLEGLRVAVIQGRVAVSAEGRRTEVPAGDMGRVVGGVTLPVVRISDGITTGDWLGNFVAFQETPLRDAVSEIESRYDLRIEIADNALARRTITAWFADETPQHIMRIICMVVEAECTTSDGGRLITIRPGLVR